MKKTFKIKRLLQKVFTTVSPFSLVLVCMSATAVNAQTVKFSHPLDPLDSMEIKKTVAILTKEKKVTGKDVYNYINLNEPPKKEVLAYKPGDSFRREAFVSLYNWKSNVVAEAVVDLKTEKVLSYKPIPNVISMNVRGDSIVNQIMKNDKAWAAALKKRGLSVNSVVHRSAFVGDLGIGPMGHREKLVMARHKKAQYEIEGLVAYVDLTAGKVLKIIDDGKGFDKKVKLNYFNGDSVKAVGKGPKPLIVTQPEGQSFEMRGHEIVWENWKLRYGVDNREGLVIYDVRYNDKGKERPIMYRGSMPEMVVPYGSPELFKAAYNFFDVGEFRLGQANAKSLTPGADAPENAYYAPAILTKENGKPYELTRAVAIYEELGGTLWRHGKTSRRATNLALKYYTTIGNYDYAFKWTFKQDGTLDVDIELTGIVQIKGVNRTTDGPVMSASMQHGTPTTTNADPNYNGLHFGTLVKPNIEAVHHQHFFVFRLDMDIDGAQNNGVMEMNTKLVPPGPENPYMNAIVVEPTHLAVEKQAQRNINYESNRHWHFMNNKEFNALGQNVGYMLMPGAQARAFAPAGSSLRKRADFLENQVWVTQYQEDERYPAGKYPGSNITFDGITKWTSQNRSIKDNDLVLWYVAGITHIVRPEDWPIMPTHHMGFTMMPFGFFNENPTVNVPNPEFLKAAFPEKKKETKKEKAQAQREDEAHY